MYGNPIYTSTTADYMLTYIHAISVLKGSKDFVAFVDEILWKNRGSFNIYSGTLVEVGLNLRVEHTHCFSDHGVGGHYHEDTTPEDVEYEGYFNLAETLYRIDQPYEVFDFGKD
ncbi:Ester hydrolase C11orf54 [Araneus ventricosus]|uniref:Ester hydrolase C11orf54 n=1 Tax=Araneus ventricosus TaxID=182803 RepID=A0A4Y2Q1W0_ARAVE|nr:Ester hydrolase C11orf54 [Araneus ventricosus]